MLLAGGANTRPQAGEEFYRHALSVVSAAEAAESVVRQRAAEPSGEVRFTAAIGTAQFALRDILMSFIQGHPKINLVEYLTSRQVDLLAENFDVAVRAHSGALADSTLVSRTLAVAPWILVAGTSLYLPMFATENCTAGDWPEYCRGGLRANPPSPRCCLIAEGCCQS